MRKCLLLARILFKNGMGSGFSQKQGARDSGLRRFGGVLLKLFLFVCLLPLAWCLYEIAGALYGILPENMKYFSYDLVCLALSFSSLLFALPYLLSVMFFAKDVELLLPMPFRSWQVAGAKLLNVLAYEYITIAFIGIPMFLGIGIPAGRGVGFWISALLTLAAAPVLPIVYGSVLGLLFVFLTRRLKNREAITTLFSILIMIAGICVGMFSSYFSEEITPDAVMQILMGSRRLIMGAFYLFPNLFLAQKALTAGSVVMALLYLASAAALIAVFLLIGNRFYLKSVVGISETSQTRELLSRSQETRALRTSGAVRAFAVKEWKLLVRTPVYLLNCVASAFIIPLIFLAMFLITQMRPSDAEEFSLSRLLAYLAGLAPDTAAGLSLLIVFGFCALIGSMNLIASTCISREGTGYIHMKYIPVPYKKQLQGKVCTALLVSLAATVPYTALLSIFYTLTLKTTVFVIPAAFGINIFTVLIFIYLQLLGDLWKPKLDWTSEQAAVKQNVIAALTMMLSILLCIALGALAVVVYLHGVAVWLIITAGIALLAALALCFRALAYRYGERALKEL